MTVRAGGLLLLGGLSVGQAYAFGDCACFSTAKVTLLEVVPLDGGEGPLPSWAEEGLLNVDEGGVVTSMEVGGRFVDLQPVAP
jgi:hypothetical protein